MVFGVLTNPMLINVFHIIAVAGLLFAIGTDRFPAQYKKYLVHLAAGVALYHLGMFVMRYRTRKLVNTITNLEGMNVDSVHYVKMFDSSPGYSHPVLQVNIGDTVAWSNIGELEHTVTSATSDESYQPSDLFDSGYMKPGETFAIQFQKPGEYPYFCTAHKGWMRGKIIVV